MKSIFTELGDAVLKEWKAANFNLAKFPEIARAAIDAKPPAKKAKIAEVMRDFLLSDQQPNQTDSPFGEPEIIVYSHPRFYIQLLFWMDGTTAIHQHEFSGAFHVMHGSSIHAHYDFEKSQMITPYLRVGNLRMKKMELLESGATVAIASGSADIHSLFHLDCPSVTVVVRTQHDPGTGPQLNYLPPHVAYDPHFSDTLMLRRKQLLDVLEQTGDQEYVDLINKMIADLDFERGFTILHHCMGTLKQLDQWDAVMKQFQKKHGSIANGIEATLKEDVRRGVIKNMRSAVGEPEHRFFLALLMNAPTRGDLLDLVAQRFPKQKPTEVVARWAEELLELTEEGVSILDAAFPESIETDLESQPELFLTAFRYFLNKDKKLPKAMKDLSAQEITELQVAFAESVLGVVIG